MSKSILRTGIILIVAAVVPLSLKAQSASDDLRFVAASWALSPERGIPEVVAAKMGGSLVLDIAQDSADSLIDRPAVVSPVVLSNVEMAAELGVRTGTLSDHLTCRDATTEEMRALVTVVICRLGGGVEAVISVGVPEPTEAGMTVWVGTATSHPRSHPDFEDASWVSRLDQQLLLMRTLAGGWQVARVLRTFHTH